MTERSDVDTDEILTEVVKRAPMLETLREQPRDPGELADALPTSRSTIHRTSQLLERAGVLEKRDGKLHLTGFGALLTDETVRFRSQVETATRLDEFLDVVHGTGVDVPLEHFTDADVLRPQPRQAHLGVDRITDLIEGTDSLRMFSSIISPIYVDVAHREMLEGTDIEVIFDSSIVEIIGQDYVEEAFEAFETGNFTVFVTESIPFELFIYDDTMAMAAHDRSALPRMFVETRDDDAIEWAETLYRSIKRDAWELDRQIVDQYVDDTPASAQPR